jgi:hypothetical protein
MKKLLSVFVILALLLSGGVAMAGDSPNVYIYNGDITSGNANAVGKTVNTNFTVLSAPAGSGYYRGFGTGGANIYILDPSGSPAGKITLTLYNSADASNYFDTGIAFNHTQMTGSTDLSKNIYNSSNSTKFGPYWRISRTYTGLTRITTTLRIVFWNNS